jgi:hypothetical protein
MRSARVAGLVLAGLAAAACGDARRSAPLSPEAPGAATVAAAGTEAAALELLTRGVARALDDAGLRRQVKNDMRRALQAEHKLDLSAYLRGEGTPLLNAVARRMGRTPGDVLALVAGMRPLEFYMPVASHRAAWVGGAKLLVVGRLGDAEQPVGFALTGERVAVDGRTPPSTPTLVLVPRETDFSRKLDPLRAKNVQDQGGQAIGTLIAEDPCAAGGGGPTAITDPGTCETGGGGGGGTYTPPPAGIYFTEMVVYDNNEPWTNGSPELEVHLLGSKRGVTRTVMDPYNHPITRFFPNEYELFAFDCAGAKASPAIRSFDFNGEGGAHYYQTVLFAEQSKFTVTEFVVTPTATFRRLVAMEPPFLVRVVERDDGRECPTAERKIDSGPTFTLDALAGNWQDVLTVRNYDGESIRYLLSGSNDPMGEWVVGSYAELEGWNGTWLPRRTDNPEIDDVIMRVSNRGFTHTTLPAFSAYPF